MKKINATGLLKFGFIVLALFPLIPNKIKGLPVVLLLFSSIFLFIKTKNKAFNWKLFFINSSIFLTYLISLLYTSNTSYALKKIETALSLLIFPLIFSLLWACKDKLNVKVLLNTFIKIFFISVFLFSIIVFSYLIYVGNLSDLKDPGFIRHFTDYMPFIGQHSIYASIYLGLGLLFSVYLLKGQTTFKSKLAMIFADLFIFLLLVSLASKGVLFATLVSVVIYFLMYLRKNKLIVLISVFLVSILSVIYSPSLSKRVNFFNSSLTLSSCEEEPSSTQTRLIIYNCSLTLLKNNWIFGYGLGDVNDLLNKCYTTKSIYLKKDFNSHNQYLSLMLGSGIFGFLSIFSLLYFNYRFFIVSKKHLFFSVLLFYLIIMLIENILERQSGVILFSFLINFFSFLSYKKIISLNLFNSSNNGIFVFKRKN